MTNSNVNNSETVNQMLDAAYDPNASAEENAERAEEILENAGKLDDDEN